MADKKGNWLLIYVFQNLIGVAWKGTVTQTGTLLGEATLPTFPISLLNDSQLFKGRINQSSRYKGVLRIIQR